MASYTPLTAPVPSKDMPRGIPYIITNEAAERFSFYGMKAILIVFMTKYLLDSNGAADFMSPEEAKANYQNIESLGFSYQLRTDFKKVDTIPVFEVDWKNGVSASQKQADTKKMLAWLKLRLQDSTLVIKEAN